MHFARRNTILALIIAAQLGAAALAHQIADESKKPHIDLAFCIDTTGSMQSEIDNVKTKMKEIVAKIAGGKPAPVIRVGLVAYRDRGDDYVTKTFQFTGDIDKVVQDISSLHADGGGDTPEAVNQAMHCALNDLKWDTDKKTLKMLFLIGDAGPNQYANDYKWETESKSAISRGIMINTIGCQGLESDGVGGTGIFQTIAKLTDGKYESLSYRQEIVNSAGKKETLISSGGGFYKLDERAARDWREGAGALAAKGKAARVTASLMSRYAAASPPPSASFGAAPMAMSSYSAAGGGSGDYMETSMPRSRADNNLSDIVLNATKAAANKKLNLEFKEK